MSTMTVGFDTLAYAKRLKSAGFTEQQAEVQAEVLADIIDERLATKQDLKELEVSLKRDMKDLEVRLTVRMGGMLTLVVTIMLGFMAYMLPH